MSENDKLTQNPPTKGWFKLSRSIIDTAEFWEIKPLPQILAIIDILLMANSHKTHIPYENQTLNLGEGERLVSLEQLAERWGWSRTRVRSHLDKWNITRRVVGKGRKTATVIDASDCFWWKIVKNNALEKNDKTSSKKTTKPIEKTTLYNFMGDLKKQLNRLEKNTVKNKNITNNMEADASLNDVSLNEWKHKVGLASCYYQKLDCVESPDFSLMARLIKEHGILLVLAKLEQLAANDLSFKSQDDAKRYVIATLKKAAIQQNAPVKFVKHEPSLLDIIHDKPQTLRFEDVIANRDN